ncbi:MAG: nucleotide sugar dehydrogenase [Gammaproteobacteria bacterium]
MQNTNTKIAIIGLGYVGFPLACELAKHFPILGFDINQKRISELNTGYDRTAEIESPTILGLLKPLNPSAPAETGLTLSANTSDLETRTVFIVTVPTPIDESNHLPDLKALESVSKMLGKILKPLDIVVFESTVYPGVTEDICGKILSEHSGLKAGKDFFLGYSPERINPGDKLHTLDKITKIISGQTPEVTAILFDIYGKLNNNNLHIAPNIRTAEAAKVIENAQRDINIAFINEITQILNQNNISIYDVLEAANTKWNFLNFNPGLVGGHCIGVDPYYLAHFAKEQGHHPKIILAGRKTNESMSTYLANQILAKTRHSFPHTTQFRILILGLTFKENVPDLRNSKVVDLIQALQNQACSLDIYDPLALADEAFEHYDLRISNNLQDLKILKASNHSYHAIIAAVPHDAICKIGSDPQGLNDLNHLLEPGGLVADLKGIWRNVQQNFNNYWTL